MLGRVGCVSPEFIMSREGSWLGTLVCIDRTTHSLSACLAISGNRSLTSMPLLPCLANLNGDIIRPRVPRSVLRPAAEGFLPLCLARAGLGSKVSTCDGPPFMNRWMMRLALGAKCERFGARGLAAALASCSASRAARPSDPRPVPMRASHSRRSIGKKSFMAGLVRAAGGG